MIHTKGKKMKYRITQTTYVCRNGSTERSDEIKEVEDLEVYRKSIMRPKYARINFVYSKVDDE